jgi:hypothetical protein
MADETPDGHIRDTSTEALRDGNSLGFRNISDEELAKSAAPPPEETTPTTKAAEPPKETPPAPPPEKVYAGKFKSAEELEKAYEEAQSRMTKATQEAAELRKKVAEAPPPPPAPKTPEQLAAEEVEKNAILNEFVADPKTFLEKRDQKNLQTTVVALNAQRLTEQWRKDNPDLAEHEVRVAFEATLLAQSDPEIAKDPLRLLQTATDNFRQFTGKIRTEGAREALTTETRTIPLLSGTTPPATEQPTQKAPLTADEAYQIHLKFLKENEQRSHRGLRR